MPLEGTWTRLHEFPAAKSSGSVKNNQTLVSKSSPPHLCFAQLYILYLHKQSFTREQRRGDTDDTSPCIVPPSQIDALSLIRRTCSCSPLFVLRPLIAGPCSRPVPSLLSLYTFSIQPSCPSRYVLSHAHGRTCRSSCVRYRGRFQVPPIQASESLVAGTCSLEQVPMAQEAMSQQALITA
ncbi:uncharacterized protein UDID_18315 [Ustilago sp. UG-2017a]|nr:uncharacterized protein UDID_18315 [Ustilago sp. UG-2017a]